MGGEGGSNFFGVSHLCFLVKIYFSHVYIYEAAAMETKMYSFYLCSYISSSKSLGLSSREGFFYFIPIKLANRWFTGVL